MGLSREEVFHIIYYANRMLDEALKVTLLLKMNF